MTVGLLVAVGAPLLLALPAGLGRERGRHFLFGGALLSLGALAALYPQAAGHSDGLVLPGLMMPAGLSFRAGGLGWLLAAVTCLVWLGASLFSYEYMAHEHAPGRYYAAMAVTLSGVVGVALAADLLTLLLFFELMTFASYFLVVHAETPEARAAGNTYLYLGAAGGLLLVAGMVVMYLSTGTLRLETVATHWHGPGWAKTVTAGLLVTGFAIKAGMVPLHVWLPQAHPVAPSPASAILSGILIKTGAYGLVRVTGTLFAAGAHHHATAALEPVGTGPALSLGHGLGYALIWFGIVTMFLGVSMALLQENAKRMLAYHSVSQMGYIIMGIGVAAYLGDHGALAMAGALYHLVNHALFKSALFMMVGAVYLRTHQLNMYRLGGLSRAMPAVAVFGAIACLGIAGVPGCNGYISKTLLHHAIVEAYEHGGAGLFWAEKVFVVTSMGTACSFIKLFSFIFLGHRHTEAPGRAGEHAPSLLALGLLAVAIVGLGLTPHLFLQRAIFPALGELGFHGHALDHLDHLGFFGWHDLQGIVIAVVGGALIFSLGVRYHLFHLHAPAWVSVDYLARRGATALGRVAVQVMDGPGALGTGVALALQAAGNRCWEQAGAAWTRVHRATAGAAQAGWQRTAAVIGRLDLDPGRSRLFKELNVQNINFAAMVLLMALAVMLLVRIPPVLGVTP